MSGESSSPAAWWSLLEPAPAELFFSRDDPEDPRLGDVVQRWSGGPIKLRAGQPVIIGFPCDEGVRRNSGRPGAAAAPRAIREQFYRFTSWELPMPGLPEPRNPNALERLAILDAGDVKVNGTLEDAQQRLAEVVASVLRAEAVPVILGGGHETAFGHYLGYVAAEIDCAIINVDAHLDVRPYPSGGHSGSPFRQAFEHTARPLGHGRYTVIGAQPQSTARAHWDYVHDHGGRVHWMNCTPWTERCRQALSAEIHCLQEQRCGGMLTVDADAFRQADVPGVSAPNATGLESDLGPELAVLAGISPEIRSFELVEVNPCHDRDSQTARWAALCVRRFLSGLARR